MEEAGGVDLTLYLVVMVGVMLVVVLISVPSLFTKRCPQCGHKNPLEASRCRSCERDFPPEES